MGFIDSIKSFYFRTFDFRTRSSRSEFWYVFLAQILFFLSIEFIPSFLFLDLLVSAINILILLPQISLTARRFHDIGMRGWWMLIILIPLPLMYATLAFEIMFGYVFAGPASFALVIIFIYLMCKEGDIQDNKYGSDPLAVFRKKN
tara:strand:+ start:120 stop:557 length:438 start_codon:yes stop_codon:yes gene_type:complete